MSEEKSEFSKSGEPIYRYETKEFELKLPDTVDEEAKLKMQEHIETHIGSISGVFHEMVSHLVHIDLYHVSPTKEKPYHTLITHGMSDLPMNVPKGSEKWKYAELICFLPEEWDISIEGFKNEKIYWVIENLKYLARFPHEYETWLGFGHTVQNDNPITPFTKGSKLCASLFIPPMITSKEFSILKVRDDKTIYIYNLFPIYLEEMQYKIMYGVDKLLDKFEEKKISDIYDLNRINVCKRKWYRFR